jgi:uncharacterized membrane-anchored protein
MAQGPLVAETFGQGGVATPAALPQDHSQRRALNDEVHARPPEPLAAPLRASYVALLGDAAQREAALDAVRDLARRSGAEVLPEPGATHYSADLGAFRLRWERHGEFTRCMVVVPGIGGGGPSAEPAIAILPPGWLDALPGEVVTAVHAALVPAGDNALVPAGDNGVQSPLDADALSARHFAGHQLIGSRVVGARAEAFTDLRIHPDGFGRILVCDRGVTPTQAGRIVQRLFEIETYRILALLAFPLAKELAPFLGERERALSEIATALIGAGEADEAALHERLSRLAAEIESREAATLFRFGAAAAYYDLVRRRIAELREMRIEGLQTFDQFTGRRLAPAIATCAAVARRQEALSARVARVTQLLSTRVEITRERQAFAVLASMDRRALLQLRLQQTVEGLSVAAIAYYLVGLVGYAAKALKSAGAWRVEPDLAIGVAVPAVALLVAPGAARHHAQGGLTAPGGAGFPLASTVNSDLQQLLYGDIYSGSVAALSGAPEPGDRRPHAVVIGSGFGGLADDVALVPLSPFYRLCFADGSTFNCSADPAAMRAEVARLSPTTWRATSASCG